MRNFVLADQNIAGAYLIFWTALLTDLVVNYLCAILHSQMRSKENPPDVLAFNLEVFL